MLHFMKNTDGGFDTNETLNLLKNYEWNEIVTTAQSVTYLLQLNNQKILLKVMIISEKNTMINANFFNQKTYNGKIYTRNKSDFEKEYNNQKNVYEKTIDNPICPKVFDKQIYTMDELLNDDELSKKIMHLKYPNYTEDFIKKELKNFFKNVNIGLFLMEYLEGYTVGFDLINNYNENKNITLIDKTEFFINVITLIFHKLFTLYKLGYLHNDIKLDNCMIKNETFENNDIKHMNLKLIDFGDLIEKGKICEDIEKQYDDVFTKLFYCYMENLKKIKPFKDDIDFFINYYIEYKTVHCENKIVKDCLYDIVYEKIKLLEKNTVLPSIQKEYLTSPISKPKSHRTKSNRKRKSISLYRSKSLPIFSPRFSSKKISTRRVTSKNTPSKKRLKT